MPRRTASIGLVASATRRRRRAARGTHGRNAAPHPSSGAQAIRNGMPHDATGIAHIRNGTPRGCTGGYAGQSRLHTTIHWSAAQRHRRAGNGRSTAGADEREVVPGAWERRWMVVGWRWSVVRCRWSVVGCPLSVVGWRLSLVRRDLMCSIPLGGAERGPEPCGEPLALVRAQPRRTMQQAVAGGWHRSGGGHPTGLAGLGRAAGPFTVNPEAIGTRFRSGDQCTTPAPGRSDTLACWWPATPWTIRDTRARSQ